MPQTEQNTTDLLSEISQKTDHLQKNLRDLLQPFIKSDIFTTEVNITQINNSTSFSKITNNYQDLLQYLQNLISIFQDNNFNLNLYYLNRAYSYLQKLNPSQNNSNKVKRLEYNPTNHNITLKENIIDFKPSLERTLLTLPKSLHLNDSSLTTNQNFTFLENILGLTEFETKSFSPTNKEIDSTQLIIKNNIPDSLNNPSQFAAEISSLLLEITEHATG